MYNYRLSRTWYSSISKNILGLGLLILSLTLPACEGFLDVGVPKSQLVSATAFENESTARSALLAIYSEMISADQSFASGGNNSISVLTGLSADELVETSGTRIDFQNNDLKPTDKLVVTAIWAPAYKDIYYANALIEGLAASTKLKDEIKKPMEGEAKFLRAFIYFYLTNLFGDIPLILSTSYETNNIAGKATRQEVYQQIIADLIDAEQLLPLNFDQDATYGRVRAGRYAAKALLARVYLYQEDWTKAEAMATDVINSKSYQLVEIDTVFRAKNNPEAIWQLMPAGDGLNGMTWEALFFLGGGATLTGDLTNLFGFDDKRLFTWLVPMDTNKDGKFDSGLSMKYTPADPDKNETIQYSMVLRLAEQYLIRAEARARQGAALLPEAAKDLNMIRKRARILLVDEAIAQGDLLTAIELERRRELFAEWGHRWFDLKRTGRAGAFLAPLKGATWQPSDELFPIPVSEIVQNPNLKPQNDGY